MLVSSLSGPSASSIAAMNLIPTPRASSRLKVPLMVGVELANTLQQLFAQRDSSLSIRKKNAGFSICNSVIV